MLSEQKKNDDDIATLSAVSKVTSKKYLDDTGLGRLVSLIVSFVRNYAAAKTHNHDGVYAAKSHNHSADNITSGVLPIGRGGTGAQSARAAEYNIMSQTRLVDSAINDNDYFVGLSTTPNTTSGATYKRTAANVWNYIKSKTSALYLPLTGGTVTGLLKTPGGTMVHNASGTSGTIGYVNIAEFNLAGTMYQNMPIQLDVFRRRMSMVTRLYIWFDPVDSSDPAIAHLGYEGAGTDTDFYMYKSATSTWQLYIKKAEGYDDVGIAEYKTNFLYMHHKITFKDVQVSSVPSGAIAGKYCDAMRATAIKDAGDGRTLKMNYSADDLTNADRFAVWNGNTLRSMHKNTVRGVIGAAASSHTHNYAGSSSAGGIANESVKLRVHDTRNDNYAPNNSGFKKNALSVDLKYITKINSPAGFAGEYCGLLSFAPWSENTGGNGYQMAFGYNGNTNPRLAIRTADLSATAWGGWHKIYTSADKPTPADIGAAASSHTHSTAQITGLDSALAGKAPTSHTHTIANVTNLQSALDGKAAVSHGHSAATTSAAGFMSVADKSKLDGVAIGANKTIVDSSLSSTSVNPVQNKVVNSALAEKASSSHTHSWSQITGKPSIPSPLTCMPVGYVYISWSSTSPASLFGGSWTAITGRFPYFNAGTGTGGANSQAHNHWTLWGTSGSEAEIYFCNGEHTATRVINNDGYGTYVRNAVSKNPGARRETATYSTTVNNMPAYQTLYAWRRTA